MILDYQKLPEEKRIEIKGRILEILGEGLESWFSLKKKLKREFLDLNLQDVKCCVFEICQEEGILPSDFLRKGKG